MSLRPARKAAHRRHPSVVGWRPDLQRFTDHMADVFAREGRPHPGVAAGVQSARGATGESRVEFATRLGLSSAWLERLEAGEVGAELIPTSITAAAPWVDWPALRQRSASAAR